MNLKISQLGCIIKKGIFIQYKVNNILILYLILIKVYWILANVI